MSNEITELSLLEHLKLKYRGLMNEHADHIATGACKDFPDYQKMVGIIEGIALAERELLDYIERVLKQ